MLGTVKMYNVSGWGFIIPDGGGEDVFVGKAALSAGTSGLCTGQRIEFSVTERLQQGRQQLHAIDVRILADTSVPRAANPFGHDPLFRLIYVPKEQFSGLKKKALCEKWSFGKDAPEDACPILSNYLRYTFLRLTLDGKVAVTKSEPGGILAFNTGLVDHLYEPIFAICEWNNAPRYEGQQWTLVGFCVPGERGLGKIFARSFGTLPPPAKYFDSLTDLLYTEPEKFPMVEWDHVLLDALAKGRYPVSFMRAYVPPGFVFRDPNAIADIEEKESHLKEYVAALEAHSQTHLNMKGRVEQAIRTALKRVQWNFKTAIPMWFPTENKMSLLLPLALLSENCVDVALVVEKTATKNYLGHTVLPLDLAYMDARLVCRPDSDWLLPQEISQLAKPSDGDVSEHPAGVQVSSLGLA